MAVSRDKRPCGGGGSGNNRCGIRRQKDSTAKEKESKRRSTFWKKYMYSIERAISTKE